MSKQRVKMPVENRAKQFMPFAALKGYEDALKNKERIRIPKAELSEEAKAELEHIVENLIPGDLVEIVYYKDESYLTLTGNLNKKDIAGRVLIVDEKEVPFDDIKTVVCRI